MAEQDISDLVEKVGDLTSATTELLGEVNVSKTKLDNAEKNSTAAATRAETAASTSTTKASEATAAKNAAEQARDQAVQIVHNDEGSLTPKPGAYALANEKGHMDIGWTPHLAALYPYSGVMGSVDKASVISTNQSNGWQNKIRINKNKFNINGRFVERDSIDVTLDEAEFTPDRAIAFDDIFLDWSGSIIPYRSITPNRTVTGYDCDAIAVEHGFSKVKNGLYKKGSNYVILLCRVTRRNQGAYHYIHNKEGTKAIKTEDGQNQTKWYSPGGKQITSINDCFDNSFIQTYGGNIGAPASQNGRDDRKAYDSIYQEDITLLCLSAEKISDRVAIGDDCLLKAIKGATFSYCEGSIIYKKAIFKFDANPSVATLRDPDTNYPIQWADVNSNGFEFSLETGQQNSRPAIPQNIIYSTDGHVLKSGYEPSNPIVYTWRNPTIPDGSIFWYRTWEKNKRPSFIATAITGNLEAMPDEWKAKGIQGSWLCIDEDGNSLLPDGTPKKFKLDRRCIKHLITLYTDDKGKNWKVSSWGANFESYSNSENSSDPSSTVRIIFYETRANPFNYSSIKSNFKVGDFRATNSAHTFQDWSLFVFNVIGKIATESNISDDTQPAKGIAMASNRTAYSSVSPYHDPFKNLRDSISPTVKVLPYVGQDKGFYTLGLYFKEMKYDGSSWGDNGSLEVTKLKKILTDNNNNKVFYGHCDLQLPYRFDGISY